MKNTIYFYNKIAFFATFLLYRFDYTNIYGAKYVSPRRKFKNPADITCFFNRRADPLIL